MLLLVVTNLYLLPHHDNDNNNDNNSVGIIDYPCKPVLLACERKPPRSHQEERGHRIASYVSDRDVDVGPPSPP
jgi:hypothetical protein